ECKTRSGYELLLPWPLGGLRHFLASGNQAFVLLHVVVRHSRSRKALLKDFATPFSAQLNYISDRFYCIFQAVHNEACVSLLHYFGNRATAISNDRCTTSHRLNHHQPEWLRPVDRKQQRISVAQEFIFFAVADLAYKFHESITQQRRDHRFEIICVYPINFRSNFKRHLDPRGNLDRTVHSFLGRNASQKSQITPRLRTESVKIGRQAVVNGCLPVSPGQRLALSIRDRDHGHVTKLLIQRSQI